MSTGVSYNGRKTGLGADIRFNLSLSNIYKKILFQGETWVFRQVFFTVLQNNQSVNRIIPLKS